MSETHPDLPDNPAVVVLPPAPPVPPVSPAPPEEAETSPEIHIRPETVIAATYEALMSKRRRRTKVDVVSIDEDGTVTRLRVKMQAVSPAEFDALRDSCPPTPKQERDGMTYDPDRFAPVLVHACATDPKLTLEQWKSVFSNPDWAGGELGSLFGTAWSLSQSTADVVFTDGG